MLSEAFLQSSSADVTPLKETDLDSDSSGIEDRASCETCSLSHGYEFFSLSIFSPVNKSEAKSCCWLNQWLLQRSCPRGVDVLAP